MVFRQVDNLICTGLSHSADLRTVSKSALSDEETLQSLAFRLGPPEVVYRATGFEPATARPPADGTWVPMRPGASPRPPRPRPWTFWTHWTQQSVLKRYQLGCIASHGFHLGSVVARLLKPRPSGMIRRCRARDG